MAVPTEHGGWGLTLEPVALGLLVAPSLAGACLGLAAMGLFVARTPVRLVLVDGRRRRRLPRTTLAARVATAELTIVAVLVLVAARRIPASAWWPLVAMVPLVATELVYDARSRSRRLVPELAGAIGIAGVAALVAGAGGAPTPVAGTAWLLLAARSTTAIPTVRDQIAALHGRARRPRTVAAFDLAALVLAVAAAAIEPGATLGALAVAGAVVVQRLLDRLPPTRAAIVGARQSALGLAVVAVAALGYALT
ncbi:MAG: YwiC-like family protein [Acidimicrobiales bacterium]|nr:YwiC-like family protein [Acidimicrobiales bacterium]